MSANFLLVQFLVCSMLTGLIWTIQLVHYPAFHFVSSNFLSFHDFHSRRITWIVAPLMVTELWTGGALIWLAKESFYIANFAGIIVIWIVTIFLSIPQHKILSLRRDELAIKKLVSSNWPRTILWTIRTAALFIKIGTLIQT